jgi:vacuolar protein sorting-associated protein 13A/C
MLKVNRRYAESGGAFKVQVYSPYLVINKTGLPFAVRSRSSRAGQPQDVAGETRRGECNHRFASIVC